MIKVFTTIKNQLFELQLSGSRHGEKKLKILMRNYPRNWKLCAVVERQSVSVSTSTCSSAHCEEAEKLG